MIYIISLDTYVSECLFSGYSNVFHLFLSSNRKIDFKKQTTITCYHTLGFTSFNILREKDMNFDEIQKN